MAEIEREEKEEELQKLRKEQEQLENSPKDDYGKHIFLSARPNLNGEQVEVRVE